MIDKILQTQRNVELTRRLGASSFVDQAEEIHAHMRRHYWEHIAMRVLLDIKCAQYGTVQRKQTRLAGCPPSACLIHISHTKAKRIAWFLSEQPFY